MKWEDIDKEAKRIVFQLFGKITGENMESSGEGFRQEIRDELLAEKQLLHEADRRHKYDYRKGYSRIERELWRRRILRVSVAACGVVLIGMVAWLFAGQRMGDEQALVVETTVLPGSNHALLQLSSGEKVILGNAESFKFSETGSEIRVDSGMVVYAATESSAKNKASGYNTLSVPRGAEYRLTLADGTLVHLNAGSELKYPVSFSGVARKVFLKGEAWFEVAKDVVHPFYVMTEDVQIRVYGTSFNVNTHGLHVTETVLAEGSIGISGTGTGQELRMRTGQLAVYDRVDGTMSLRDVEVREYTAWKEGIFYFDDDTLEEILEELARWYDVEIFFHSSDKKGIQFSGHLKRYEDIRKILNTITESTGIEFEINDRIVTVK